MPVYLPSFSSHEQWPSVCYIVQRDRAVTAGSITETSSVTYLLHLVSYCIIIGLIILIIMMMIIIIIILRECI